MSYIEKIQSEKKNSTVDMVMVIIAHRLHDPNITKVAEHTLNSYSEKVNLPNILSIDDESGHQIPVPVNLSVEILHRPRNYDAEGNFLDIEEFSDFPEQKLGVTVKGAIADSVNFRIGDDVKQSALNQLEALVEQVKDTIVEKIGNSLTHVAYGSHEDETLPIVTSAFPASGQYMQCSGRDSVKAYTTFDFNPEDLGAVAQKTMQGQSGSLFIPG